MIIGSVIVPLSKIVGSYIFTSSLQGVEPHGIQKGTTINYSLRASY